MDTSLSWQSGANLQNSIKGLEITFIAENVEIFSSPPCGLLIGIYLFYENWSTETSGKKSREED
jgi:hypothetical protein